MTNTNQFQEVTFDTLQAGDVFKFSPEAPTSFIYGYKESNGVAHFTCLETGEIQSISTYTEVESNVVYKTYGHKIQYLDANGDVFNDGEIQLDIIIEGLTQEVADSIEKLDLMLSDKKDALEELDDRDPNMYEYLKEITEERYKLLTMANNIRPKLNK